MTGVSDSLYLVEVEMAAGRVILGAATAGTVPAGGLPLGSEIPAADDELQLYLSDRNYVGPLGDPDREHVQYLPRVIEPIRITREVPWGAAPGARQIAQYADIVLADDDGYFAGLLERWSVEGRPVRVYWGQKQVGHAPFGQFGPIADGVAVDLVSNRRTARLRWRDRSALFERSLPSGRFAGTGGLEGDAELEGTTRPVIVGRALQVSGLLSDAAHNVWYLASNEQAAIDDIRMNGAPLAVDSSRGSGGLFADYEAFRASDIDPGKCILMLAPALVRTEFRFPESKVTARVGGRMTPGQAFTALAEDWGGWGGALHLGAAAAEGEAVYYQRPGEEATLAEALDKVAGDGGLYWGLQTLLTPSIPLGALVLDRLRVPEATAAGETIDGMSALSLPDPDTPPLPAIWRQRFAILPRQDPLSASELVGAAEAEVLALTRPWRELDSSEAGYRVQDAALLLRHPDSVVGELFVCPVSDAADRADGEAVWGALFALYGKRRRPWRLQVDRRRFQTLVEGRVAMTLAPSGPESVVRLLFPDFALLARDETGAPGRRGVVRLMEEVGDEIMLEVWA